MEKNTPAQLEERAYHIWERAGRPHGQALEHWLQAQSEISTNAPAEKPKGRTRKAAGSKASAKAKTTGGNGKPSKAKATSSTARPSSKARTTGGNGRASKARAVSAKGEPAKAKPKKVAKSENATRKASTGRKPTAPRA